MRKRFEFLHTLEHGNDDGKWGAIPAGTTAIDSAAAAV
jgi:hypothetical protein